MSGPAKAPVADDVAQDHDRQMSARDDLRGRVDEKVGQAIEREANVSGPEDKARVESVAQELKAKSVSEIRRSESELDSGRHMKRIYQFVNYAFYVVYGIIGLMTALELFGARDASGFMHFMRVVTTPLLAPFRNVMPDPSVGSSQLMFSYILALIVYALLHLAVKGVFKILVHRDGGEL